MPRVGAGQYTYEVVDNWGTLPPSWTLGVVTGIAVDSQERVYVCQQHQDPPVIVFDREGNYLDSWGTGLIVEPHTLYIGPDDVMYLADRGDHVALQLTLGGQAVLELGNRGQPSDTGCTEDEGEVLRAAGPFNRPTRMSPSPSGDRDTGCACGRHPNPRCDRQTSLWRLAAATSRCCHRQRIGASGQARSGGSRATPERRLVF